MKKATSKLTGVLIATVLCALVVPSAWAQDKQNLPELNALAARGEILANEDPLSVELRDQQPNPARRGFYIGMGVAEGQTYPGPGKDRICASLPGDEPRACSVAVLFSVDRNRNAKLAATGAAIARADPAVASERNASTDVFYRLGFDIATGIFGNPAQGALGNTLTGPGSLGIRDSLSRTGQRGFNASVSLHLGRTDARTPESRARVPAKEPSNEIRCRGYSRPGGSEYVFFTHNSRPSPTGETIVTYEMAFTPGPQAAGARGEGLRPGQCAWADRPIGDNGPFRIRFETVANAQLKQQLHGSPVDRSSTAAESYPDVNSIPIYLKGETHYWSFGGVTNAGSYFRATGNSYWKPAISVGDVIQSPTERARPKGVLFPSKP
jgi:hypothetical protein